MVRYGARGGCEVGPNWPISQLISLACLSSDWLLWRLPETDARTDGQEFEWQTKTY